MSGILPHRKGTSAAMSSIAWLYITLCCCLVAVADARQSVWMGYSLPPYSSASPQNLGQLVLEEFTNGTIGGSLSSWTPPPPSENSIQIGLLSSEPGSGGFSGSTVQVAHSLLLADGVTIEVNYDQAKKEAWGLRVSAGGSKVAVPAVGTSPEFKISTRSRPPAPFVNKPVVVSAEGKVQDQPQEKTLLQKYWWVLLAVTFLVMSGGGGDGK